jgi:hypothetical protein
MDRSVATESVVDPIDPLSHNEPGLADEVERYHQ